MSLVKLINITDYPGRTKTILEIYGISILPGDSISMVSDLLDDKIFAHEYHGQLAINDPPDYYQNFKRPSRPSKEQIIEELRRKDIETASGRDEKDQELTQALTEYKKNRKVK